MKLNIRSIPLYFLLLISAAGGMAQVSPAGPPRIGRISGVIADAETKQPLEYAVVAVFRENDTVPASGGVTDDKGRFVVTDLIPGRYRIRASFIGYDAKFVEAGNITPDTREFNAGIISLSLSGLAQKEVEIVTEKSIIESGIDKKVYNIGKDISAAGGTVADVLQNIPSVTMDEDRNIQLRGSGNVNILIDGKPSNLSARGGLEQLPANMIEKVEVITNPSAKFDPDGTSGIINIITKKNTANGLTGTVSFTAGTGLKNNGALNLAYRENRFNAYLNISGLYNLFWNSWQSKRNNYLSDTTWSLDQSTYGKNWSLNPTVNGGLDLYASRNSTISLYGLYGQKRGWGYSDIGYDFLDSNRLKTGEQQRHNDTRNQGTNYEASLSWKQNFKQEGRTLNADISFSGSASEDAMDALQKYISDSLPDYNQVTDLRINNAFLTPQINYVHPLMKGHKIETGVKGIFRYMMNDLASRHLDEAAGMWVPDTLISNRFEYRDRVLSTYAVYTGAIGNFGFSAGLRGEMTHYSVTQVTLSQFFQRNYYNLFPSVALKYRLKNAHEAGISWSRRINRPNVESLNPFPEWTDPYNFMYGNPYLLPEYIQSFELSYKGYIKKFSFNPSLFYRHINGAHTRFRQISEEGVSTVTFRNMNGADEMGGEIVVSGEASKWLNFNTSLNLYYRIVDAGSLQPGLTNNGFSGNFRLMANVKFWKNATAQLIYNYSLPYIIPQGRRKMVQGLDLAVKKDFMKDRLSLTLRLTDVFNTREFNIVTEGSNFDGTFRRKRETRIGYVGLAWRFGKGKSPDAPQRRRSDEPTAPSGEGF